MSIQAEYRKRTNGSGHFFDPDTMAFFNSRIGLVRIKGDDWYFVTSEKSPHEKRMYSVRKMSLDGDISHVVEYGLLTKRQAEKVLEDIVN